MKETIDLRRQEVAAYEGRDITDHEIDVIIRNFNHHNRTGEPFGLSYLSGFPQDPDNINILALTASMWMSRSQRARMLLKEFGYTVRDLYDLPYDQIHDLFDMIDSLTQGDDT